MKLCAKLVFILVLSGAVLSCTDQKKDDKEVVPLEEFLPKAEREYNYPENTVREDTIAERDSLEKLILETISNATFPDPNQTAVEKQSYFPDRLDFEKKFAAHPIIDSINHQVVLWIFEDSLHTVNAFYNWMDCFGKGCKSINIGEEKMISDKAFQLFVGNRSIILISSESRIDTKLWNKTFIPLESKTWNYELVQQPWGKVRWIGLNKQ